MEHKTHNIKHGFSLVETLVAVSIVVFSVLGPVTLTVFSLKSSSFSKNNLIAGNLAQEGIELVRAKSKSNMLACAPSCVPNDWLNDFNSCFLANGCSIDASDLETGNCASANQCFLRFEIGNPGYADDGIYNHGGGSQTQNPTSIFRRVVKLTEINSGIEVKVNVEVSWTERFGTQKVIVEENMFNWQ